jgi:hypothetical protein
MTLVGFPATWTMADRLVNFRNRLVRELWQLPQSTALAGRCTIEAVARPPSRMPYIDPYSTCGNCHSRYFGRVIGGAFIRPRAADRV